MDAPVLTVRAKYIVGKKGNVGVLMMTETRFKWMPNDPQGSSSLDHPFDIIKAHFSSKGPKKAMFNLTKGTDPKGDGFVFEFDNFRDRDMCRDHVAKVLGRQNLSAPVQPVGQPQKTPLPTPTLQSDQFNSSEMERRVKILQTDSGLQKLFSQLVISGVLSEAEFWNTRKHMLENDTTHAPKQRTGLKSAMLADVRPLTDGRTNKVLFNLTPEIIHQIFAEKPAVHRAFLQSVPVKACLEHTQSIILEATMSEVTFWTKYCRAEYLYRTKNQAAAAAEAADDEDLALFTKADDIILSESQRKIRKVDPTLDMAADFADDYTHLPGHGTLRDGGKEPEDFGTGSKRSIMNDINRHAAVVLDGSLQDGLRNARDTASVAQAMAIARQVDEISTDVDVSKKRSERIHQMTLNEDLQGPPQPQHVPLRIQDPRKYFDSQHARAAGDAGLHGSTALDPSELLENFHKQLAAFKAVGLPDSVVAPDVALKVMHDLTREISASRLTIGRGAEKNVLDSLPRVIKDDIMQHSAVGNELLRHFWASYPLTSSSLLNKVNRLKEAMGQLYTRMQKMKEAGPAEHRHIVSQLLQPILQALDAGFAHYDEQSQRRESKTGVKQAAHSMKPNGLLSHQQVKV